MRRLSVVHASGLSLTQSSTSIVGAGVGGDGDVGIGAGVAATTGTQQTALALAAAPPVPRTVSWNAAGGFGCLSGLVAAAVIGSAVSTEAAGDATLVVWAAVGLFVALGIYNSQYASAKEYNDKVYRPKKAIWDHSIMCMRCGVISEQAEPSA